MTSATKRKHVVKEMLDDFSIPSENQTIVKVLGTPGSNLHEVSTSDGKKILCSLPLKFRKNIWIKRGDFVVIEPIDEGDKVKAEIVRILYPQHVKYLQKEDIWPSGFLSQTKEYNQTETTADNLTKEVSNMNIKCSNEKSFSKGDYILNMDNDSKVDTGDGEDDYYSSDDDLTDIPANTNRPTIVYEESTSDSESDLSSVE
ncbi:putative RNA-binding protein EIF1AD [Styela clava]|uniref:probable RNA-binding protein EIF1AD n=1 Tax=Styela clava TaxID=7725 RepID=UPI00193A50B6|nr:probable RNA-binding protein EIF1AD [Styela clava]